MTFRFEIAMKALTICQPYPTLILRGDKRVENRTWATNYRGQLYLHAGKSRAWLDVEDGVDMESGMPVSSMVFGAVVAIVNLIDCLPIAEITAGKHDRKYHWLREHRHTNGPWCWVFDEKVTPIGPWPWKGAQGLFDIPDDALDAVANREIGVQAP